MTAKISLEKYEKKIYCEHGEDGIIEFLISLIDNNNKFCIEIGAYDGFLNSNTLLLREKYNYNCFLVDCKFENQKINLYKYHITKDNICGIFKYHNVPNNITFLSIDIDSNDFYILHQIIDKYNVDIIICEYNATHLPNEDKIVVYEENNTGYPSNYFGASLLSFKKLLNKYNYYLVYVENTGTNAFFCKKHIIDNSNINIDNIDNINNLYKYPTYGTGPNGGHTQDIQNKPYLSFDDIIH